MVNTFKLASRLIPWWHTSAKQNCSGTSTKDFLTLLGAKYGIWNKHISFWSHLGKLNKYGLDSAQFATFPPTLPWKHPNACFKEKWDQASQVRHGHCHRGGPKPPILTPDTDKTRRFKEWPTGCLVSCQCELPAEHPEYKGVALWGNPQK